jgi:hypothetical protein
MSERLHSFDVLGDARGSARQLVVDGVLWLVYDLPPLVFDRRNTLWLVFENDDSVRRVRDFPEQWRTLSDKDLFALS